MSLLPYRFEYAVRQTYHMELADKLYWLGAPFYGTSYPIIL